jgi:hypothetical protein
MPDALWKEPQAWFVISVPSVVAAHALRPAANRQILPIVANTHFLMT